MLTIALLPLLLSRQAAQPPLVAQAPITVPGGAGHYDFMNFDGGERMVFAAHPGKSSFTVVNLDSREVKEVDATCEVNGLDADPAGHKLYAAGPGKTLVQFDTSSWMKTGSLPLDGPGDSVIWDAKHGTIYVDNDDGTNLWFVDPSTLKVVQTVTIKEAPEVMVLDNGRGKIFQNIKSANAIQVVDIEAHKVVAEYPLGDLTSPHGLAEDAAMDRLYSVGKNGKLVSWTRIPARS